MAWVLAFDAGATHTRCAIFDADGNIQARGEAGPCNPTSYGLHASIRSLVEAGRLALSGARINDEIIGAAAVAGAVETAQRIAIGDALNAAFGLQRTRVSTDLHPVLFANARDSAGILVIAGTGSNVLATNGAGDLLQIGGRGTLLGDEGSGYAIGVDALRLASRAVDGWGDTTSLVALLTAAAGVDAFEALVTWGAGASKRDIAALSKTVLRAADAGDGVAIACVTRQANLLAEQVLCARARLGLQALAVVYGVGGLFEQFPLYRAAFDARLAMESGLRYCAPALRGPEAVRALALAERAPDWAVEVPAGPRRPASSIPSTESVEAGTMLDLCSPLEIATSMLRAEADGLERSSRHAVLLADLVSLGEAALCAGGRIIYAGAGTSGRLGVLDAAECGPTFSAGPTEITALIAGGPNALREAAEGAEDDEAQGALDVTALGLTRDDLVVGIAASGATPYVRGALGAAADAGCKTALIACSAVPVIDADLVLALDTGPEQLPGSTRLKAGTATKVCLNILSTGAFARSGRVYRGRMVAMRPTNAKLRARAVRMVLELTHMPEKEVVAALESADWCIRTAILMLRQQLSAAVAREQLAVARGDLGRALNER